MAIESGSRFGQAQRAGRPGGRRRQGSSPKGRDAQRLGASPEEPGRRLRGAESLKGFGQLLPGNGRHADPRGSQSFNERRFDLDDALIVEVSDAIRTHLPGHDSKRTRALIPSWMTLENQLP